MTNELNMNVDVPVFSSEKRKMGKIALYSMQPQ